jgi:type IV pilus assembly protein PilO
MMNKAYFKEILNVRIRTIIVLVTIVIINIGLMLFLNFYQRPKLVQLHDEWFKKRKSSGTVLDRGAAFEKGSADIIRWQAMIAPKKDLARIVGEIYEVARSNSLSLGGITYKPELLKTEKMLSYVIGFTVTGRYAAIKSFIGDVGRLRDIVSIDSISLSNPKLTEEIVSLKLNLTVYLKLEGQ